MKNINKEKIKQLAQMVEEFNVKNSVEHKKEIILLTQISDDTEEQKILFTPNVIMNMLDEILKHENIVTKDIEEIVTNFLTSSSIVNHVFKKNKIDILNGWVDGDILAKLIKVTGSFNLKYADIKNTYRKNLEKAYIKDKNMALNIAQKYNFELNMLSLKMENEDIYIEKFENLIFILKNNKELLDDYSRYFNFLFEEPLFLLKKTYHEPMEQKIELMYKLIVDKYEGLVANKREQRLLSEIKKKEHSKGSKKI